MKKINRIFVIAIIIFILSACDSNKDLLTDKMESKNIDKIQIVLAMGNPEYGAKSKIITDKEEVSQLVDIFNKASIGKEVKEDDIAVSDTSRYYFYSKDTLIQKFSFNGNDSERIWYNSGWYYITYPNDKPYEVFESSEAEIFRVDEDLNEM